MLFLQFSYVKSLSLESEEFPGDTPTGKARS
jgi:hypothetical protein